MDVETIISSAAISAAVSGLFAILSTLVSKRSAEKVAEETTRREIEKLKQTWLRDDKLLRDKAFTEMIDAVTRYIHDSSYTKQAEAQVKTAIVQSIVDGELADKVTALDNSLRSRPARNAETCLRDVIACKQLQDAQEPER